MNGGPTGWVTPSTVTADSSITSSNADCVFGDARLISSASTMDAKTGPGWNSKAPTDWSKMVTPVTSDGSRSGVNWIREVVPEMVAASALASVVLPVPGTSSSNRCPSETRQINDSLMASGLPTSARPMASVTAEKRPANRAASAGSRTGTPVPSKVCTSDVLYSQVGMVARPGGAMAVARYHFWSA